MINLLPLEEKRELIFEDWKRLAIILGSIAIFFLISLALILFSIQIYIRGQVDDQKIILEKTQREYEKSDIKNLQEAVKEYNINLLKLQKFYAEEIDWSGILDKISKIERPSIYFTNLSLNEEEKDKKIKIAISGFSKNRDNLSQLKESLEKEKDFKEIYFSPSSWIKQNDIDFYLTFNIAK